MRKLLLVVGGLLAFVVILVLAAVLFLDPDDYRDEIAARASTTLGREVFLEGPISLRVFPWLALEIEDVAVGNPPDFGEAPSLARIGSATAAVRLWPLLRGELEIGAVTLSEAHFAVVTNRGGQSNLDGLLAGEEPRPEADAPPDLSRLSLGRLQLRDVAVEILDLGSGERTLARLERLDLDPFRPDQSVPVSLRGSVSDGDGLVLDALQLDGNVRVAANMSRVALEAWRASFELPTAEASGSAEGALELHLDQPAPVLNLQALSARLNAAGQDIGLTLQQPLRLVLDDAPAGELAAARLTLNDQALDLAGSFVLADPLTAELQISGARLDLRPLIPDSTGQASPAAGPANGAADFSALVGPRLGFDLDLGELIIDDGLRLADVSARARLRDGLLLLEPLQAGLFGGSFAGSVSVDFTASPPLTRINPSFTGIRAEQVASLVSEAAPLRGLGELNLDFRFSGLSVGEILSSLDGDGSFSLDDGALLGVDLRRLIEDKLTVSTLSNVNQAFGGETPFRRLSGSIRAESGVVTLPDLNLSAADFGASGQGRVDFAAGEVAYRLDLSLGEALVERLPRQLARATGGVIPLAIAGPMTRPVVQVDLAAMAEGAIQRELQDRLLDRLRPADAEPETQAESDADRESSPQRRERTSDLLLRTLRDRQEREREPDPPPDQA